MRRPWLVLVFLFALAARGAHADPVVMVLDFDNDSGDAAWDALGKGLADMMVTDLSGLPGVQVVEREKLSEVLAELKLQRTKYFDPKTAQKIGRGVGAAYAVTGALISAAPDLRIDVRVVRITTGEVVKADKVIGKKDKFFELQQQLVARLAAGLAAALGRPAGAPPQPKNRVDDVGVAVDYGTALQLRDGGDLKGATQQLEKTMRGAPGFTLARSRYMQFMKELHAAKETRSKVLAASDEQLLAALDKHIASNAARLKKDAGYAINWRMSVPPMALRGDLLLRRMAEKLEAPAAELRAAFEAYMANQLQLLEHQLTMMGDGPYAFGYGLCHDEDWRPLCLNKQEMEWATDLHLTDVMRESHTVDGHQILQDLHALIMFGTQPYYTVVKLPRRVCLYKLDAKYPARALEMLDRGIALLGKYERGYGAAFIEDEMISQHVQRALHFLVVQQPEEAVASLQAMLNRYPKSKRFAEIESMLRTILAGDDKWANGKPLIAKCEAPR